jgi:hypothetical protein
MIMGVPPRLGRQQLHQAAATPVGAMGVGENAARCAVQPRKRSGMRYLIEPTPRGEEDV